MSALVIGCGKKDSTATQVVAKVDGEEISIHQINTVLAKATGVTQESLPRIKQSILDQLVTQQIAINEATSKKLDHLPEVVTAIENAKREILARAVFDQIAATQPKPTDEDAKKYYAEHPELFSQRRVFSLQEIVLGKTTQDIGQVRDKVATAKSMDEISAWLKDKGIEFTLNGGTRAAEQIPLEVLPKLHLFKDSQIGLLEGQDAFLITRLVASRSAPLEEGLVLPKIKVFLYNQRGGEAVKREQATLKAKAKVEYLGEFTGGEAAFKAKIEADTKAATSADVQTKAKAKADADALAKQKADEQAAALAEAEARSKARAESRAQSSKDQKPVDPSANVNLEQGIKGLK